MRHKRERGERRTREHPRSPMSVASSRRSRAPEATHEKLRTLFPASSCALALTCVTPSQQISTPARHFFACRAPGTAAAPRLVCGLDVRPTRREHVAPSAPYLITRASAYPVSHIGWRAPQLNHERSADATGDRAHVMELLRAEDNRVATRHLVHDGRAIRPVGDKLAAI